MDNSYIMVTPCKNEEQNLDRMINSILSQDIKPKLWVIVNDGSTDNSLNKIISFEKKHGWIRHISLKPAERDLNFRYSIVCKIGFDKATELSKSEKIRYGCIALVDADMILEKSYFKKLLKHMNEDKSLGVVSGGIYYQKGKRLIYEKMHEDRPMGAARLWSREAFTKSGGYKITSSPDSVSNIKVVLRGWKIRQFKDIKAIQTRETSSAQGLWNGYWAKGEFSHYLGTSPVFAIGKGAKFIIKYPFYPSLAYLSGYFNSLIKNRPKIDDKEIIDYYSKTRIKEKLGVKN